MIKDVGAFTWCDGNKGRNGTPTILNSMIGKKKDDQIGSVTRYIKSRLPFIQLSNGNYLIKSETPSIPGNFITWGDGNRETSGFVDSSNSFVVEGTFIYGYFYGGSEIVLLPNGNYVILDPNNGQYRKMYRGSVTWVDGNKPLFGFPTLENSLIGESQYDALGSNGIRVFPNGDYIIGTERYNNVNNVNLDDAGAATLAQGSTRTTGIPNKCNTIIGEDNYFVEEDPGEFVEEEPMFPYSYNPVYEYMLAGLWKDNKVTIMYSSGMQLAGINTSTTQEFVGNTPARLITNDCSLIAILTPQFSKPFNDTVTATVWIENTQPTQFVKRHYEITPATNAENATAKITLYFTQPEFDDFNAVNTVKLPMNSDDAAGKANLLIEKASGVSSNGTGLTDSYTGSATNINPADEDIVWNSLYNRWEVSFDVTGFGGFFVKTSSAILPISWLSISGTLNNYKQPVISFKVSETNVASYVVEKSADSRRFNPIGTISSKGNGTNTYSFTDTAVLNGTAYYRIKQVDRDNHFSYSSTVRLSNKPGLALMVYPNPVTDIATISNAQVGTEAVLTDASGKLLQRIRITSSLFTVDMGRYTSGIYILKCNDGNFVKIVKE